MPAKPVGDVIVEDGDLRKYRVELPNLIDDLDLSPYEYRLYGHYKRRAGATPSGYCNEGTRKVAQHCKMSVGRVSEAKHALAERGLIKIIPGDKKTNTPDTIRIIDIWQKNFRKFSRSEDEQGVHESPAPCSQDEHPCSPHELKKEPLEERTIKKELIYEADAPAPPDKIKKKRESKADPRTDSEAIRAIYAITGFRPPTALYDEIIDLLGLTFDKGRLSSCRVEWLKRGYNPKNWAWLFTWYQHGIPENGNGSHQQQPRTRTQYGKPEVTRDYSKFDG